MDMLDKETKMKHDTIYVAYKEPFEQHPQIGRVGICNGTPILEKGWGLFSYMTGEDAETIFSSLIKDLNEVQEAQKEIPEEQKQILGMLDVHDADKDFWRLPIRVLDGWMLSAENYCILGTIQSQQCGMSSIFSMKQCFNITFDVWHYQGFNCGSKNL